MDTCTDGMALACWSETRCDDVSNIWSEMDGCLLDYGTYTDDTVELDALNHIGVMIYDDMNILLPHIRSIDYHLRLLDFVLIFAILMVPVLKCWQYLNKRFFKF